VEKREGNEPQPQEGTSAQTCRVRTMVGWYRFHILMNLSFGSGACQRIIPYLNLLTCFELFMETAMSGQGANRGGDGSHSQLVESRADLVLLGNDAMRFSIAIQDSVPQPMVLGCDRPAALGMYCAKQLVSLLGGTGTLLGRGRHGCAASHSLGVCGTNGIGPRWSRFCLPSRTGDT